MNNRIAQISALVPFIYLIFIWTFFIGVKTSISDGNPDPKNYPEFFFISNILMLLVPFSFLLWVVVIIKSIFESNWELIRFSPLGIIGFSLIVLLVKFDPMGILNWLAD